MFLSGFKWLSYFSKMVDNASAGERYEGFGRETLERSKDLERMTEQMENISVNLTWMTYDIVVVRTDPRLAKSLERLKSEFVQCKAVICGSGDNLVDQLQILFYRTNTMALYTQKEKMDIAFVASTVDLDSILIKLDTISETLDQLEVKTQLLQCNLTVCFTHPDMVACLHSGVEDSMGLTASPESAESRDNSSK
ncbi:hypothetical protein AMELA_G00037240 [Ameiurus melas]|uniref:Uncharacterized protein n=1 Tax=Ameiurus melas TaxID=219545 RepID=A0A7J6B8T2_AMEME|nr:hypothetical protein AMELA_G00037240 [Ameiurus melas]